MAAIAVGRAAVLAVGQPGRVTEQNPMTRIRRARSALVGKTAGMRSRGQVQGPGRANVTYQERVVCTCHRFHFARRRPADVSGDAPSRRHAHATSAA
jgi:hypothetical protein